MSAKKRNKNPKTSLSERVAKLETDVSWLKKIATGQLFISSASLLTLVVMVAVIIPKLG